MSTLEINSASSFQRGWTELRWESHSDQWEQYWPDTAEVGLLWAQQGHSEAEKIQAEISGQTLLHLLSSAVHSVQHSLLEPSMHLINSQVYLILIQNRYFYGQCIPQTYSHQLVIGTWISICHIVCHYVWYGELWFGLSLSLYMYLCIYRVSGVWVWMFTSFFLMFVRSLWSISDWDKNTFSW